MYTLDFGVVVEQNGLSVLAVSTMLYRFSSLYCLNYWSNNGHSVQSASVTRKLLLWPWRLRFILLKKTTTPDSSGTERCLAWASLFSTVVGPISLVIFYWDCWMHEAGRKQGKESLHVRLTQLKRTPRYGLLPVTCFKISLLRLQKNWDLFLVFMRWLCLSLSLFVFVSPPPL